MSTLIMTVGLALNGMAFGAASIVEAAPGGPCSTSKPQHGGYQVRVCFSWPDDTDSLHGITWIATTVQITGKNPGIRRAVFNLNGEYLLTDYQAPYAFKLPTNQWVDGNYQLEVRVYMRDGFTAAKVERALQFQNGITTPPVNQKSFTPRTGSPAVAGEPFVVVAAGDGAGGETSATGVVNLIAAQKPNLLLYLGDVYEKGTRAEFFNWYGDQGAYFSRFRDITDPTIGNHEYSSSPTAEGYFDYWDNIPEYYSFNAGGWHFVSLNSNARRTPIHGESDQFAWLEKDLSANDGACTIVFYHHPYLNIGSEGPRPTLEDIWRLMARHGVSLVLNGHDHNYQRWVALDGDSNPSPTGITEFVVGGGGHGVQPIIEKDSRVAFASADKQAALGVLKLSLDSREASFAFISLTGATLDSGTVPCGK